jgi:hypothetical protein
MPRLHPGESGLFHFAKSWSILSAGGFDTDRLAQLMSASVAIMGTAINAHLTGSGLVIVRHFPSSR